MVWFSLRFTSRGLSAPHMKPTRQLSDRRDILCLLASAGLVPLVSCDKDDRAKSSPSGKSEAGGGASTSGQWASGGTTAMTAKASYPDPFTSASSTSASSSCARVTTTTAGPCTTEGELLREDISEGWSGLPVRLAIRVVDASCHPLPGVTVKVWHTNSAGSYSGQTPNSTLCLQQQAYSSQDFFRGVQTTDPEGKVFFDTCFPGWYRGRAIHIHFQVKDGSTSYRVSQLFFPEEFTQEVFESHPEYRDYGQPDTVFATDNILAAIPVAERERHILTLSQMPDGALLASKVVAAVGA